MCMIKNNDKVFVFYGEFKDYVRPFRIIYHKLEQLQDHFTTITRGKQYCLTTKWNKVEIWKVHHVKFRKDGGCGIRTTRKVVKIEAETMKSVSKRK